MEKKLLEIKRYPSTILKKKAKKIKTISAKTVQLIANMGYTMDKLNGIGLAAPQVGIAEKLIVYKLENKKRSYSALINPKIIDKNDEITSKNEGCLSVPDFRTNIKRFNKIIVNGIDENEKHLSIEAKGLLSIILQHEIDHLNGILIIDHIGNLKRNLYKKRILKQRKLKR